MKNKLTCFALLLILFGFGCKKDASEDITKYDWVLASQTISPAVTIDGKTSTDYLSLQNPQGCTRNNTLSFSKNGVFYVSSNGALCDMLANNDQQKWIKTDQKLLLKYGDGYEVEQVVEKDKMINTSTMVIDDKSYSLVTVRKAEKKK